MAKMNLQPLRDMAKSLNIEFYESDTVATLKDKITNHLKHE